MEKQTLILPLEDPTKHGATEHVRAIRKEFETNDNSFLSVLPPLSYCAGSEGDTSQKAVLAACEKIGAEHPEAYFQILSSDYGAEPTRDGPCILEQMKEKLGETRTAVFVSTHSLENASVVQAFEKGILDRLALPASALSPEALGEEVYNRLVRPNEDRFIRMVCVPHATTLAFVKEKEEAWRALAQSGKVPSLDSFPVRERLMMVVLPGDVDNGLDEPLYYTPEDAKALAYQIKRLLVLPASRYTTGTTVLFTNSPRVFKYNKAAIAADRANFRPNEKRYQNQDRMKGRASNPVSQAFYDAMTEAVGLENVIDMTIQQGLLPAQAFLAGYGALNAHAKRGGESLFVGNGESATMCAEAITVLNPHIVAIAAETPAMLQTHRAALTWLCHDAGLFSILNEAPGKITYRNEDAARLFARPLHDAKTVMKAMVAYARRPAPAFAQGNAPGSQRLPKPGWTA